MRRYTIFISAFVAIRIPYLVVRAIRSAPVRLWATLRTAADVFGCLASTVITRVAHHMPVLGDFDIDTDMDSFGDEVSDTSIETSSTNTSCGSIRTREKKRYKRKSRKKREKELLGA